MAENDVSSVMDRLAKARQNSDVWAEEWPSAGSVGKIVQVRFVDTEQLSELDSEFEEIKEEIAEGDFYGRSVRYTLEGYWEELHDQHLSDGDAVLVTVELPDGSRFSQLFEKPQTREDTFFRLCRGLGVDVQSGTGVDGNMIVGEIIPVKRVSAKRWEIDLKTVL